MTDETISVVTCTRPLTNTVGAMALAAVVSGCAGTVAGTPTLAAPPPAGSTELKSARVPALSPAPQQWLDVTDQGIELPRDAVDGAQYSATPVPGAVILHAPDSGNTLDLCSLGPAVRHRDGRVGFLTAGHCAIGHRAADQYVLPTAAGDPVLLGRATAAVDNGHDTDSAVIYVDAPLHPDATLIAGVFPVTGTLSAVQVQALPKGTPICVNGARTGVDCGPLLQATPEDIRFTRDEGSESDGDSGAVAYVVSPDRSAKVVGLYQGCLRADQTICAATYIQPTLERINVEIVRAD